MKITLNKKLCKAITLVRLREWEVNESSFDWKGEVTFNLKQMELSAIQNLEKLLHDFTDIRGTGTIIKDIETWIDILETKSPKMRKLSVFEMALTEYMMRFDGHRVYMRDGDDNDVWLCYLVTEIKFHDADSYHDRPAYVNMTIVWDKFGVRFERDVNFYIDDIIHMTVQEILARKSIYTETKELREKYLCDLERYRELIPQIGRQFLVDGVGISDTLDENENRSYNGRKKYSFPLNGKVVIDIFIEDDGKSTYHENHYDLGTWFWDNAKSNVKRRKVGDRENDSPFKDEAENPPVIEVPIHTAVVVFDLQRHIRLSVHVGYLKEYIYDENLADKLILSEDIKKLIKILIKQKEGEFKDIIFGKSGGAIILLTGPAGVGKTLTAQVFAEAMQKPLYSVQASQLGIRPEELERELQVVLRRASRWNAITLLDEADVYVHERGDNLVQNAIVGVLLRILEYYTSVLFMTTNRPDIVDDAIASRCIARIDYEKPSEIQQKKIWKVLAEVSGIKLSDKIIETFVEKFSQFSGRDIKNILKLAHAMAVAEDKDIDVGIIEYVTQFNPTIVQLEVKKK